METVSLLGYSSVVDVKTQKFTASGKFSLLRGLSRLVPNQLHRRCSWTPLMTRCQSSIGFKVANSKYRHELKAAIDVVERACELCRSVQTSMNEKGSSFSSGGSFEKKDATPVTVADFGVQALVSLELGLLFPSIPLVGEEDAGQLRKDLEQNKVGNDNSNLSESPALIELVTQEVAKVASNQVKCVTTEKIMDAIDRGGKRIKTGSHQRNRSYWTWRCPVGLALVVDGELVLGVMGCPNVSYAINGGAVFVKPKSQKVRDADGDEPSPTGLVMAACTGCGCWVKPLSKRISRCDGQQTLEDLLEEMTVSKVDECMTLREAKFCISDHEVWSSLPLAGALASRAAVDDRVTADKADILPLCCGSLCKYFAVASGGASLFILHLEEGSYVKVWDHAAGVICVTEAGGQVTDVRGKPVQEMIGDGQALFKPEGGGILVTNGRLGEKVRSCFTPAESSS
ncbi:hypothetical protein R1flu_009175 [Riccia fluitans]|uniref:3'(2'),5'-bisphosphate nucleotidase n=1 Tax=Riccia fluitans TaxID=41844 RepID=A0ABD1Z1I1_9MARC